MYKEFHDTTMKATYKKIGSLVHVKRLLLQKIFD